MTTLTQLKNFIAIVEAGSFNQAARKLHQSNPSTSRQLSELEDELQQVLIVRNTRTLDLTEFGQLYYQRAKELIERYDILSQFSAIYSEEPVGTLKIVGQMYPLNTFILPKLNKFCSKFPRIIPDIETSVRPPTMHAENVDITITFEQVMEHQHNLVDNLVKRYLFASEIIFCCSPRYKVKNGVPTTINELRQHRYITNSSRRQPRQVGLGDEISLELEPSLYVNDTHTMIECAKNHIGIIQVAKEEVTHELSKGNLIELLEDYSFSRKAYVYYKKNKFVEPKVRKFIDFFFAT